MGGVGEEQGARRHLGGFSVSIRVRVVKHSHAGLADQALRSPSRALLI